MNFPLRWRGFEEGFFACSRPRISPEQNRTSGMILTCCDWSCRAGLWSKAAGLMQHKIQWKMAIDALWILLMQQRKSELTSMENLGTTKITSNSLPCFFSLFCSVLTQLTEIISILAQLHKSTISRSRVARSVMTSDHSLQMIIFKLSFTAREAACKLPTSLTCLLLISTRNETRQESWPVSPFLDY